MAMDEFCGLLKLVSNPNRLRILVFLRDREYAVGEIESGVGLKQPNLSHELRKLRDSGLVSTRRQSKVIFYSLSGPSTEHLVDGLATLCGRIGQGPAGAVSNTGADTTDAGRNRGGTNHGECSVFSRVHSPNPIT